MKKYLAALALIIVAAAFAMAPVALAGCGAATPQQKSFEADTGYTTELENCTKNSKTLTESKVCEAQVDIRWHVDGGVK